MWSSSGRKAVRNLVAISCCITFPLMATAFVVRLLFFDAVYHSKHVYLALWCFICVVTMVFPVCVLCVVRFRSLMSGL